MEDIKVLLMAFLFFFGLLLILYYLLPAGVFYTWLYLRRRHKLQKIQPKRPSSLQIEREVKLSLWSILIFAIILTFIYWAYQNGMTKIYLTPDKYGYIYLIVSPIILAIIHDSYFYWTHRLLHTSWMFRRVHRTHHQFHAPTPWAIYAFHPIETLVQFAIYLIAVFILPLHPIVLAVVMLYSAVANAGGHCGFEITPRKWTDHWLMKYNNTVNHHDSHHSRINCNYSLYFNIWDRITGTFRNN